MFIELTLNARLSNYMLTQHQKSPLNMATRRPPILIFNKYQHFYSPFCSAITRFCLLLGKQLGMPQELIYITNHIDNKQ